MSVGSPRLFCSHAERTSKQTRGSALPSAAEGEGGTSGIARSRDAAEAGRGRRHERGRAQRKGTAAHERGAGPWEEPWEDA
eukprot:2018821-Prymnesium_polylepis.2